MTAFFFSILRHQVPPDRTSRSRQAGVQPIPMYSLWEKNRMSLKRSNVARLFPQTPIRITANRSSIQPQLIRQDPPSRSPERATRSHSQTAPWENALRDGREIGSPPNTPQNHRISFSRFYSTPSNRTSRSRQAGFECPHLPTDRSNRNFFADECTPRTALAGKKYSA